MCLGLNTRWRASLLSSKRKSASSTGSPRGVLECSDLGKRTKRVSSEICERTVRGNVQKIVHVVCERLAPDEFCAPSRRSNPSANSSTFSVSSVTNFSKSVISRFSLWVRCALTCVTSSWMPSRWIMRTPSQINIHESASFAFGANTLHFTSSQPIKNTFGVYMDRGKTDSSIAFPQETQKSCQLSSLDGTPAPQAPHPTFRASHASVPSPHHDPTAPLTTHTHSTCLRLRAKSHRWRRGFGSLRLACASSCVLSDSHLRTDKWLFLQLPSLRGVRRDTSVPRPIFLRRLWPLVPILPNPLVSLTCY